jgi:hypothetical protein
MEENTTGENNFSLAAFTLRTRSQARILLMLWRAVRNEHQRYSVTISYRIRQFELKDCMVASPLAATTKSPKLLDPRASAIQIVRPLESIAETQPQLQPGFTEILSDYFPILHPVRGNRTHDYVGGFELRIRVRERQATLDLHAQ